MIFRGPWRLLRRRSSSNERAEPTPDVLFADLARARRIAGYDEDDRRRDFHAVFFGSDAGKRVLHEILAWSHLFASTFVPGDSHATHWREGGRDVGLRILAALNSEPPVPSASAGSAAEAADGEGARP